LWGRASQAWKNPQLVIPKGGVCPRDLLFLKFAEKQIPRVTQDDNKGHYLQSVWPYREKRRFGAASQAAEKVLSFVILSEAKNLSSI
jgi:hypothetical protein